MTVKTCRGVFGCGEAKDTTEFGPHKMTPDGLATYCRSCESDRAQIRKHGLTRAQKATIAALQGGCAICHHPEPGAKGWVVDHDHECCPGEASCEKCRRGVLCQWCNNVLGYAFDRPSLLRAAADYLESGERLSGVIALLTDSTESVDRVGPLVLRTDETDETNADLYSPTRDISPSVTRARTYGFEVWS